MSWHEEYHQALLKRNEGELRSKEVYDHYARLAKRVAGPETHDGRASAPRTTEASARASSSRRDHSKEPGKSDIPNVDLAEAQRARAQLESKLKTTRQELESVNTTSVGEKRRIKELMTEHAASAMKLRDRDEELREKSKLLDNVHDEMLALTVQLNVIEEHNQKLKSENQDLVDRWMARMGQEADAMNDASRFS